MTNSRPLTHARCSALSGGPLLSPVVTAIYSLGPEMKRSVPELHYSLFERGIRGRSARRRKSRNEAYQLHDRRFFRASPQSVLRNWCHYSRTQGVCNRPAQVTNRVPQRGILHPINRGHGIQLTSGSRLGRRGNRATARISRFSSRLASQNCNGGQRMPHDSAILQPA